MHKPVLLQSACTLLAVRPGAKYVDATLGGGGHAAEIIHQGGKVLGLDQDPQALLACSDIKSLIKVRANFSRLAEIVKEYHWQPLAGIIFDLGLSSLQLDDPQRGFSFQKAGHLDMRLDPDLKVTAGDLINHLTIKPLSHIFKTYGEIPKAQSLARRVIAARPIETTSQLAYLAGKFSRQVFQALRIAVNDELGAIKSALQQIPDIVSSGTKVVVISFHSLEDRLVKQAFSDWKNQGLGQVLTHQPIRPTTGEISDNSRSKSAKLRAFNFK